MMGSGFSASVGRQPGTAWACGPHVKGLFPGRRVAGSLATGLANQGSRRPWGLAWFHWGRGCPWQQCLLTGPLKGVKVLDGHLKSLSLGLLDQRAGLWWEVKFWASAGSGYFPFSPTPSVLVSEGCRSSALIWGASGDRGGSAYRPGGRKAVVRVWAGASGPPVSSGSECCWQLWLLNSLKLFHSGLCPWSCAACPVRLMHGLVRRAPGIVHPLPG